jgi:hypothetical protein
VHSLHPEKQTQENPAGRGAPQASLVLCECCQLQHSLYKQAFSHTQQQELVVALACTSLAASTTSHSSWMHSSFSKKTLTMGRLPHPAIHTP